MLGDGWPADGGSKTCAETNREGVEGKESERVWTERGSEERGSQ